jgi:L-iditol 2-dehydrogenase
MKAAIYYDTNDIRIEERDLPVPGKGEALIKMHACGLCGTDIHKAVHKTVKPGTVLGHEVGGEIVQLGEGVENFRVGDRVFVALTSLLYLPLRLRGIILMPSVERNEIEPRRIFGLY